ncbi:MAG: hypothetical protein [Jingmen bat rhabdovirus 1]|nr:MAG: hypothetical protein [Jingmen bat rhabdovirus 1]WPV62729.1 MAG: hypothetical protein [Jingmen bat rhabdovirus 1]WPV62802.1 MAG: hypothetical protein [Jingmen bat rhabdovirus 1]
MSNEPSSHSSSSEDSIPSGQEEIDHTEDLFKEDGSLITSASQSLSSLSIATASTSRAQQQDRRLRRRNPISKYMRSPQKHMLLANNNSTGICDFKGYFHNPVDAPWFTNNLFTEKVPSAPPYKWNGVISIMVNITLTVNDGKGMLTPAWVYASMGRVMCQIVSHPTLIAYWSVLAVPVIKLQNNKWLFRGKVRWDVSNFSGDLSIVHPINFVRTLRNGQAMHTISLIGDVRTVPNTSDNVIGGISVLLSYFDSQMMKDLQFYVKENLGLYVEMPESPHPIDFVKRWKEYFNRALNKTRRDQLPSN